MAELVYLLCALTSLGCGGLLLRGYRQRHSPLLLWSSLCFAGLAANNILLFLDLVIVPTVDLSVWRAAIGLGSLLVLIFGLVWDTGE
jgi:hypothetical protein